jgi:hypothetical protein
MVDHLRNLPGQHPQQTNFQVNPHVATYRDGAAKAAWTGQQGLSEAEAEDYRKGATRSVAAKSWVARGSIGLVTSSLSSASEQAQGLNDWHTVAMARLGDQVWVHDPGYDAAAHAGNVNRMDAVAGTRMVHALVREHFPSVQGVYFQGPPSTHARPQLECMGRSTQWVEATVAGTLPWPPNRDASGGQWKWYYQN